jgi:hypothetical protein
MRVRYFCHAGQDTGYGRAATELALALVGAGVDLSIVPLNPNSSRFLDGPAASLGRFVCNNDDDAFDVAIVHTMPLDCAEAAEHGPAVYNDNVGDRPIVAYTTWEGIDVPADVVNSLRESFTDVWVPSNATYDAFLSTLPSERSLSTFILPHTFRPRAIVHASHSGGGEQRFRFYYVGAWTARKNTHGLIRAFSREFTPDDKVELVVHSPGVSVESFTAALVATGLEQHEQPSIRLSNQHVSDANLHGLIHDGCDCFVTATRGEAWNLPAFEAMLAGRMVIAPAGMGHDDFLFDDPDEMPFEKDLTDAVRVASVHQPAFVDIELIDHYEHRTAAAVWAGTPAKSERGIAFKTVGAQGLSSRTTWRDPDLTHLARAMRSVFESQKRDITLNYSPEERFGRGAVAKRAIDRLAYLLDRPTNQRQKETSDDDQ